MPWTSLIRVPWAGHIYMWGHNICIYYMSIEFIPDRIRYMIVAEMRAGTLNLGASMQCKAIYMGPHLACSFAATCLLGHALDSTTGGGI
jgi:hypothetical protein